MKNKIQDLRDHLFETIEGLKDPDAPMDLERAEAISKVAQTIINSAKVEVDFMRVTGASAGSGFLPAGEGDLDEGGRRKLKALRGGGGR